LCRKKLTIRIAIIGAGMMGADHACIFAKDVPDATLQVVCDAAEATAKSVADEWGAHDIETDPLKAIIRSDVDAVLIASPDPTHAGLTLAAFEVRKSVLCEKPLAVSSKDALLVLEAECKVGHQLVQVGFMRRFDPSYLEMKTALVRGEIGAAVMMHNFHRNVSAPPGFTGLMAITNSAPHEFDAIRYVLDTEITNISAFEPDQDTWDTCKPVVMIAETGDGQLATIEVNNNAKYGYDVRGELVGTDGSVTLEAPSSTRRHLSLSSSTSYAEDWRPRFREAYRVQNQEWIRSIKTGTPSEIAANAWDGYCATAIAEAGVSALKLGQKTPVDLVERPDLYKNLGAAA